MRAREKALKLRSRVDAVYLPALRRAYFRFFGHTTYRRFVIVGNARTGSNYLLDGLKSSPAVRMYHELFAAHNREIGKDFDKTLSTLYQPESRSTKLVGFKVFYNHLTEEEWEKLVALRDLKVIHLTRWNRLRTIISLEIAFKTGQWTRAGNAGAPKDKRVVLDPRSLMKQLEDIEKGEAATRLRFCDRQILEITYEELVGLSNQVFESVGAYLGVEGMNPGKIRLKKQNPEPLPELILNYDEIRSTLKNTRFAGYLDDPELGGSSLDAKRPASQAVAKE